MPLYRAEQNALGLFAGGFTVDTETGFDAAEVAVVGELDFDPFDFAGAFVPFDVVVVAELGAAPAAFLPL